MNLGLGATIRSPLFAMCIWIAVGTGLYQLRWSDLFQDIRGDTAFLLWIVFALFALMAYTFGRISAGRPSVALSRVTVLFVTVYYVAAFADNGGIPLIQILRGQYYDVYSFGIPSLHVLVLSFSGYYGVRALRRYLDTADKGALATYVWVFLLLALIANRSALSFLFFASVVLYLRNRKLRVVRTTVLVSLALVFLVVFGQFGNTRLSHQINQDSGQIGSADAIVRISHASPAFVGTGLAPAWLWPYMYLSSPLANLNQAFEFADGRSCGQECDLTGLVAFQLVPDVVGARVGQALETEKFDKSNFLIASDLTASTTFGSAVGYAGLVGAVTVLLMLVGVSIGAVRVFRNSEVSEEGIALLATVLFFSFFENMLAYSPMSLQLIWAIVRSRRALRYL